MANSISPFKGVRERRNKRRDKRRENRKLRKEGPKKQFYGGSEADLKEQRERAGESVADSQDRYRSSADRIDSAQDRASELEGEADSDYSRSQDRSGKSRRDYGNSISAVNTAASNAINQRKNALLENNLNQIAEQNILANQDNAQSMLRNNIGIQNRAARGLAGSMGEGGALALQQAMAQAGQGAADQAAQTALEQQQLAASTRFNAANQQVANALATANLNAGDMNQAAQAVAQLRGNLLGQDLSNQAALGQRQNAFLAQSGALASQGGDMALQNQGQMLNNEQTINSAQLGVDMKAAQDRYEAAKNGGFTGFMNKLAGAGNAVKGAADSFDMGPTDKLLGSK